ncbi:MAG: gliding motility protein GldM [Chitinophagaceae bacterium]|nr:gliding motility protein GldM [Chitinophagaceae bacterium]
MALPKEPRQKMINIMYLVLTALLALNVSSEILNAFKTVNRSLENTNTTVNTSTATILSSLEAKAQKGETAAQASYWLPRAKQAQQISENLYQYIENLKNRILTEAGGDANDKTKPFKEDNLDIVTNIMVKQGEGKKLLQMLTDYKGNILKIDSAISKQFANFEPINTDNPKGRDGKVKPWEIAYFNMVPTVAGLTILSKFQNDIRTFENKVVEFCHSRVGQVEVIFNQYEPIVGQNSKVFLPGQELEITAGLAAFNSDRKPTVYIGNSSVPLNEKGLAVWRTRVNSSGRIPVRISFVNQQGKTEQRTYEVDYTVGQSNAAIQLDKMNVLFIGVDNPITVSGSGNLNELRVSASGGGITLMPNGPGKYLARVTSETDNCVISVTTPDGKTTSVNFRVRSIPDPTPYVGRMKSGDMSASEFKSQAGVRAIVENFFYETQFTVTGFRITGDGEGFDDGVEEAINTGAAWNEARKIVNKCRPGSFITIEDIRAVGPDNRTRKLTPMIFNLK